MTAYPSKIFLIMFSAFCILVSYSKAQDIEDPFAFNRDLRSDEIYDSKHYMTGDWGGIRSKLYEMGIKPTATYYISVLSNPVGGQKKGVQYAGLLNT